MKQTFHVNIAGFAFKIDEEAYQELKAYLSNIEKALDKKETAKEVLQDVEMRIAEIFTPIVHQNKAKVITRNDIREIIKIIGAPTDFGSGNIDEEPTFDPNDAGTPPPLHEPKKLYRDPYNRVLGGVCSGLAGYFNLPPIFFRLICIIGTLAGVLFLPYIILWIALPKAVTIEQRRQMFGDYEIQNKSKHYANKKSFSKKTAHKFWNIVRIIVGLLLIVTAFVLLMFLTISILFPSIIADISPKALSWYFSLKPEGLLLILQQSSSFIAGLLLVISIPLFTLLYLGFNLLFNFQKGWKIVGPAALLLWLIGLGMMMITFSSTIQEYKIKNDVKKISISYEEKESVE